MSNEHTADQQAEVPAEDRTSLAEDRTERAEERTELAEDRTLMANERTFAGWIRTGLAAVGIGLGFNALFGTLDPWWLPRAIATIFILIGIVIFYAAQKTACRVYDRLDSHSSEPVGGMRIQLITLMFGVASGSLVVALWLMSIKN
ncbi:YidH family protein [Parasphingorhabdus sp.]|uniref:YidH family protein n=1 Tax=Parasphingorhabdus sp. TaxID=2709688 RepID=UPI003002F7F9